MPHCALCGLSGDTVPLRLDSEQADAVRAAMSWLRKHQCPPGGPHTRCRGSILASLGVSPHSLNPIWRCSLLQAPFSAASTEEQYNVHAQCLRGVICSLADFERDRCGRGEGGAAALHAVFV